MTEWYQPVRAQLIMAQVHLKLREPDEAKTVMRQARALVPEHHDGLRGEILAAEIWVLRGHVGRALAAIDGAIAWLDKVAA